MLKSIVSPIVLAALTFAATLLFGVGPQSAAAQERQSKRQTWIFAGQSNMNPGAHFTAFEKVVEAAVPGLDLSMVQSQRGGYPIQN